MRSDDAQAPGVPLAHYRQHRADVNLTCRDCVLSRVYPLEAVISRPGQVSDVADFQMICR